MKTTINIFLRDLRRIGKNVMAIIVMIGVCIIPALYAWFNIAANWNPYGSTSGIKVAVANEDEGYTLGAMPLNIGAQIIASLKANDQIGWQFVDTAEAIDGVKSGEYYAAVVIPPDFSQKISSILSTDIESPKIQYYINEKKNAIAPKITDKGVSVIQQQVNSTFISVATETIARLLDVTASQLESSGMSIVDQLMKTLHSVSSDLEEYELTIDAFMQISDSVAALLEASHAALPELDGMLDNGTAALNHTQDALGSAKTSLHKITGGFGEAIDSTQHIYDTLSDTANSALSKLETDTAAAADKLAMTTELSQSMIENNQESIRILTELNQTLPKPLDSIKEMIARLEQSNKRQKEIIEKVNNISGNMKNSACVSAQARKEIADLAQASKKDFSAIRTSYNQEVEPQLNAMIDDTVQAAANLSSVLQTADGSLTNMDGVFSGIQSALASGENALTNTKAMIEKARSKTDGILAELENVGADERLGKLMEIIRNDPAVTGSFMSSPVQLDTTSLYPIENYGSAMTPFYSTLALWVGGIVLVAILKVRVDEDETLRRLRPAQCYFGRYFLFFLLGQIQALIICLGDLFFLNIQCKNPFLFLLAGAVSSMVYTNIIYTLTVSFGDIGKALCVILLVIQIAGAGGTFPIEVTPRFFQNVYPFLPFTYGINAMRETVAGIYQMSYWSDLLHLLAYIPVSLALGLFLRKPLIHMNDFFEKRLEDTRLM